jgi:asparagine N-glycosylation enzyme membrane subunit Stt3
VSALQKKLWDEFKVYALVVLSVLLGLMALDLVVPGFPVSIRPGALVQLVVGSLTGMALIMWWYPVGLDRGE